MTPQGVRNMVVRNMGVLESRGMSQEDWEQSLRTDYRVEPLPPPTWVVYKPPGQHLATMEGALVDEWYAEPDVTLDQLLRQLTRLAKGTSQACSYQSQESYFRHRQRFKETMRDYEPAATKVRSRTSGIDSGLKKLCVTMKLNRDSTTVRDPSMWTVTSWGRS